MCFHIIVDRYGDQGCITSGQIPRFSRWFEECQAGDEGLVRALTDIEAL